MTPAESVARDCAELATMAPLLTPALRRDQTGTGRYGRLEVTLSLFNTDVLLARNRLMYEIPAAAIKAALDLGETWRYRPIGTCLRQLPVFAARMAATGLPNELRQLETLTGSWRRQTKRALGLRRPDVPVVDDDNHVVPCPSCETHPSGDLYMAGSEATINPDDLTAPPQWRYDPRVYCTVNGDHVWPEAEWDYLGRLVKAVGEMAS